MPGVKIVAPSTAGDAKALLKAAIRDDNPVLVFEHKLLYGTKGPVADVSQVERIGTSAVRRRGSDVSIVAALAMSHTALEAAEELRLLGIEAEVIDLRCLRPLDDDLLAESAARSRHVVVVEEGPPTGGYASEVISSIAERVHPLSISRVTMPDIPLPASGVLEDAVVPTAVTVVQAVQEMLGERSSSR